MKQTRIDASLKIKKHQLVSGWKKIPSHPLNAMKTSGNIKLGYTKIHQKGGKKYGQKLG